MSSLLERMIQRARAPIPGVEPLLQPRYARPEADGRQSRRDAPRQAGESPEARSSNEFSPRFSSEEFSPEKSGSASRRSAENTSPIAPAAKTHIPAMETPIMTRPAAAAGQRPQNAHLDRVPSTRLEHHLQPPAEPAIGKAEPVPPFDSGRLEKFGVTRASVSIPVASPVVPAIPVAIGTGKATSSQRQSAEHATLRPPASNSQRPAPVPQGTIENRTPDVTIAIGHVEVRAAQQVVERPRRPAFRPRVSLSDFLRSEAPGGGFRRSGERP
jgi:hypothetical protein